MRRSHEFIATRDLYKEEPNEQGEYELVLIKENLETRWLCGDLDRILEVEEHYDDEGIIKPEYTRLTLEGNVEKIVKMTFSEVIKLLKKDKPIGYGSV